MKTVDQLFEGEGWYRFADTINEELGIQCDFHYCRQIFGRLPEPIQALAFTYGLADTDFNEETADWLVVEIRRIEGQVINS